MAIRGHPILVDVCMSGSVAVDRLINCGWPACASQRLVRCSVGVDRADVDRAARSSAGSSLTRSPPSTLPRPCSRPPSTRPSRTANSTGGGTAQDARQAGCTTSRSTPTRLWSTCCWLSWRPMVRSPAGPVASTNPRPSPSAAQPERTSRTPCSTTTAATAWPAPRHLRPWVSGRPPSCCQRDAACRQP